MPTLTQALLQSDVVKMSLGANYNAEEVTLLSGIAYAAGAVLGIVTASGKYTLATDAGVDGTATAVAVLMNAVDASLADAPGLILARGPAIVASGALSYDATVNDAAKIATKVAQLAAVGIVTRTSA